MIPANAIPLPGPMRKPCAKCDGTAGYCLMISDQATVRCANCHAYAGYNAPKTELGLAPAKADCDEALSASVRARIIERANARCELCGVSATDTVLHVGHLLSRRDAKLQDLTPAEYDADENLCAMCKACNLGLGKTTVPLRLAVAIIRARLRRLHPEVVRQGDIP